MGDRRLNAATIQDFLDEMEERIGPPKTWEPGLVFRGDTEGAGTARHEGDTISVEAFEERLAAHRREHGPPEGIERITLNVVAPDPEPFEQETRTPDGQ